MEEPVDLRTLFGTLDDSTMKPFPSMVMCLGLAISSAAAAPDYWPIDLGHLGGTQTVANGLNDAGQVVGWSKDASGRTQAFAWSNGVMTGLGFLPGGTTSVANAVNNRGHVAGYSYVSGTAYHGFLYASNSMADIGALGTYSQARAINAMDELTGSSPPTNFPSENFSFLWKTNRFITISSFSFAAGSYSCDGYGINDFSQISGSMRINATANTPRFWGYVWEDANGNGTTDSDERHMLGSLGVAGTTGSTSVAFDINDLGQVVGWTSITNDWYPNHAMLVTPSNGVWKIPTNGPPTSYDPALHTNFLMRDLGTLDSPTNNSYAHSINDRSWIVGTSSTRSGTNQAFLWHDGVMSNLNDLIVADSGWVLTNATGINEFNEIVGNGLYNGQPRAFILRVSPGLALVGTNGLAILDSEPPNREKGSDFGPVLWGTAATNVFTLRNLGTTNATISGWTTNGSEAAHFQFFGIPSALDVGDTAHITVVFSPPTSGVYRAVLSIASDSAAPLTNVLFAGIGDRLPQAMDFPPIPDQWITNAVGLAATADSGLAVEFAVASGPAQIAGLTNLTFTGAGEVAVVATQPGDEYWAAAPPITNVFSVLKMPAAVFLDDLAQIYDGTAREVSATTDPTELAVEFTYDGLAWAPTNAGTYAVTGTIVEALWEGWTNDTLVVAPADQTIDFPAIPDQWITNAVGLAATADSGLAVEFAIESGPAEMADFTNLTFTGTGWVTVVATQPGDANWNPAPPVTNVFRVSKMPAAAFLHDLFQTYDGTARMVSATTEPEGLAVELTYDGLAWAPTNAGTYVVTGTIAEANWEGWTNGALVVAKADQTIEFPAIPDQWTTNFVGLAAAADSGLAVEFEIAWGPAQLANGTNLTFTGPGSVAIVALQPGDSNWNPAPEITNVFLVSKMPAAVYLDALAQTYDGTARTVSATTDPAGLVVEFTYNGLAWAPTNAGTYAVTGTIAEANWEGWTNGVLVVAKADQTIEFPAIPDQWTTNFVGLAAAADSGLAVEFEIAWGPAQLANGTNLTFTGPGSVAIVALQPGDSNWNPAPEITNVFLVSKMPAAVYLDALAQTYDGTARTVSATTDPAGLVVEFTYNGLAWAPTNAGTYAVTGTIAEANWEGWTNGTLVVAPADQSIDFPAIPDQFVTNVLSLAATADSGLPVEFALAYGPAAFADPTSLTFSDTGAVAVVAAQAGDANWNPAPPVTNVFTAWGLYVLTIATAHGESAPPVGIYTNRLDSVLTNSIDVPDPAGGTQLVCAGWAMTGHEPASGSATNFTMVVTNNATLTWLWTTNYWLETSGDEHGSVAPTNCWQPAGHLAILVPLPHPYYHFTHWTGSASGTNYPFALFMDRPKSVQSHFAENLAIHDVPEWWLALHGWTNDFDAAALADDEPDGFPTWQEFVADTIPTNALSYPRIASILAEGTNAPIVAWLASTGRAYQVHFSDDFPGGTWSTQQLPMGAGEWTDTNPPLPPWRVYRLAPLRP